MIKYYTKLLLVRKPTDMDLFGDDEHRVIINTDIIEKNSESVSYKTIPYYGYEDEYYDNLKDYSIIRPVYYNIDRTLTSYIYEYHILKWYTDLNAYRIIDLLNTVYQDFKSGVYYNIPIEIAKKVFGSLIPDTFNENTDAVFFYSD